MDLSKAKLIVLILVLMEDALVQPLTYYEYFLKSRLNPCFNGRCTRTYFLKSQSLCRKMS